MSTRSVPTATRTSRIQGCAPHLHRLPSPGRRPQGPQRAFRREVRELPRRQGLEAVDLQPRRGHQVRPARQAPHGHLYVLPQEPAVQASSSATTVSPATRRTTSTRSHWAATAPVVTASAAGRSPRSSTTTSPVSRCWASTRRSNARNATRARCSRRRRRTAWPATRRTTSTKAPWALTALTATRRSDWKTTTGRFDHDRTKFKLRNAHAVKTVKCDACHKDLRSFRDTAVACYSCHKKDDKHEGEQGKQCEQCHSDRDWKVAKFDHSLTRFPLTGLHVRTTCKSCHETSRYKEAPRDCYCLPREGRQAQAQVWRRLRELPQHARLVDLGLRPRQAREVSAGRRPPQGGV